MSQNSENLLIKKIGELRDICFDIPTYQRGYRWGEEQVRQMLEDFSVAIREKQNTYYLQPIVLRSSGGAKYELIDGQQRLTTLWILCNSAVAMFPMIKSSMPNFSITYQTKGKSTEFLQKMIAGEKLQPEWIDQENFLIAYDVINTYLKKLDWSEIGEYIKFVSEKVRVIWYEVTNTKESGKELFMKINRGRIPLTNAELIKAYLLAHVTDGVSKSEEQEQRQIEITSQWDDMEHSFHDPSFWAFIAGETEDHWQDKPRMEYFFDLIAPPEDSSHDDEYRVFYHYAESINKQKYRGDYIRDLWRKQIRIGFLKLKEWYEDRILYHKIGYLISVTANIAERKQFLNKLLNQDKPKNQFICDLDNMIRETIGVTEENPLSLDSLQYGKDNGKLKKLLLLFNVLCCIPQESSDKDEAVVCFNERYSFEKHHKYKWSLEHVNPQSEGLLVDGKRKIDIQDMVEWLKRHLYWLKMADEQLYNSAAEAVRCNGSNLDGKSFSDLRGDILEFFNKDFSGLENSIGNLALLSHGQNASLGNDLFVEKRRHVLDMISNGEFVPPCTRRLFLKFYSAKSDQLNIEKVSPDSILSYNYVFWTREDAENYRKELENVLSPYLTKGVAK